MIRGTLKFPISPPPPFFFFWIINNSSVLQLFWLYWYGVGQLPQISRQEKQGSQGSNAAFQLLSSSMALQDWVFASEASFARHIDISMVAQLELEGILGLLSAFHFTSDNVHLPQLQPLLQAQRKNFFLNAPNHTNVHLIVRHWGCSTFVCALLQYMKNDRVSYSLKDVNRDTLERKRYRFWFCIVFTFFLSLLTMHETQTQTVSKHWTESQVLHFILLLLLTDKTEDAQRLPEWDAMHLMSFVSENKIKKMKPKPIHFSLMEFISLV